MAAGIEKLAAFHKVLALNSGRIAQLYVASNVAQLASVDVTTVQSWNLLLQANGIIELVQPFSSNLNKRLTKTPKLYFQDVSLAVRLQGWTSYQPLYTSPQFGHVVENIVYTEIHRYFINQGKIPKIYHLRSKEGVEVDFLVELDNQRFVAIEAKSSATEFSEKQLQLLDSLKINIVAKICSSLKHPLPLTTCLSVPIAEIWDCLNSTDF